MYEVYTGLLKMMDKFQRGEKTCCITYELDADYSELKQKYSLEQMAGEYYAKDLFWMMLTSVQGTQKDFSRMGTVYYCAPEGFDVKKHMLANIQYREELWGKQEWLEQRKKMLKSDTAFIYQDLEALYDY